LKGQRAAKRRKIGSYAEQAESGGDICIKEKSAVRTVKIQRSSVEKK